MALELKFTTVLVRYRRVSDYANYIRGSLERGHTIIHILAQGNLWITKAHRITEHVVQQGWVNVFNCEVGEEPDDTRCPFVVITLVSADKLSKTSPAVWSSDQIQVWERKEGEYKAALREPVAWE